MATKTPPKGPFPFTFAQFWDGSLPEDLVLDERGGSVRRSRGRLAVDSDPKRFPFEKVVTLSRKGLEMTGNAAFRGFLDVFEGEKFKERLWVQSGAALEVSKAPVPVARVLDGRHLDISFSAWDLEDAKFAINASHFCTNPEFQDMSVVLETVFEVLFGCDENRVVPLKLGSAIELDLQVDTLSEKVRRKIFETCSDEPGRIVFRIEKVEVRAPSLPVRAYTGLVFPLRKAHLAVTVSKSEPTLRPGTEPGQTPEWVTKVTDYEAFGVRCLENLLKMADAQTKSTLFAGILAKMGDFCSLYVKHWCGRNNLKAREVDLRDFLKFGKLEEELGKCTAPVVIATHAHEWISREEFAGMEAPAASKTFGERVKNLRLNCKPKLVIWVSSQTALEANWMDISLDFQRPDTPALVRFHDQYFGAGEIPVDQFTSLKFLFAENDILRVIDAHHLALFEYRNKLAKDKDADSAVQKYFTAMKDILKNPNGMEIEVLDIPKITWDDIGGLDTVKNEFELLFGEQRSIRQQELVAESPQKQSVEDAQEKSPEQKAQKGVIFFGPPGTGKTLLAKCLANTSRSSFISVKGPELLNMYVGESEKNMREVFEKAKKSAPCVLFFDELDSLLPARGSAGDSGNVTDRLVAQFLTELDSLPFDLLVIAATNRPDLLDSSILTSGKFDKKIYLGVFDQTIQRLSILRSHLKGYTLEEGLELAEVEQMCPPRITGADFAAIVSGTVRGALKRCQENIRAKCQATGVTLKQFAEEIEKNPDHEDVQVRLRRDDFAAQIRDFKPSVAERELQNYQKLAKEFADITVGAVQ